MMPSIIEPILEMDAFITRGLDAKKSAVDDAFVILWTVRCLLTHGQEYATT